MSSSAERAPGSAPPSAPPAARAIELVSPSEDATLALAEAVGRALEPGDVIGLTGDLGAGKTVFVRGLARGCETAPEIPVCSPTFTLANVYPGRLPLYHLDLYRLADDDELEAIGYRDYTDGSGAVAVEWCDQVGGVLPADHLRIALAVVDVERRSLRVAASGPRSTRLLAALEAAAGAAGLSATAAG